MPARTDHDALVRDQKRFAAREAREAARRLLDKADTLELAARRTRAQAARYITNANDLDREADGG